MRTADYIFSRLADLGARDVFMLTGGGAMHLNDAVGGEPRLKYWCMHHEQAAAMAAEAYARVAGTPAIVQVTTGPGGINALNGVFGAWTDSIPMVVVSGQVKRETTMAYYGLTELRQLGDQEADIISMVRGITKSAISMTEPLDVRYEVERAWHLAQSGRPGPVWIDVPIDVQAAKIDPQALRGFAPTDATLVNSQISGEVADLVRRLAAAERPVFMLGSGVRLSRSVEAFARTARRLGIPVTTAWTAHDAYPTDDPLYCGRPGSVGDRGGNFVVQNADLLIILGCKLAIRQISYNWEHFARHAFKVQVDIDPAELRKPTVRPDLGIVADIGAFLKEFELALDVNGYQPRHHRWTLWGRERFEKYDLRDRAPEITNDAVNPYGFVQRLSRALGDRDVIACGDGTACVVPFQVATLRGDQRLFTNAGSASMGYDLPAAVGAAIADPTRRIICLAGDGSAQLNIQELQTIKHHRLNVKIFILDNEGYLSIRMSQSAYFKRLVGEGPTSGVSFPDYARVAEAYGIRAFRAEGERYFEAVAATLATDGPALCHVILDAAQQFEPKLSSRVLPDGRMVSSPLEDMAPFLERDEFAANMLVPQVTH